MSGRKRPPLGRWRLLVLGLAAAAIVGFEGEGLAKTIKARTEANKEIVLAELSQIDEYCRSAGLRLVKRLKEPAHGKLVVKKAMITVSDQVVGGTKCMGRQVPGMIISYIPDKNYRGLEEFHYRLESTIRQHVSHEYDFYLLIE